jgi:hypothetical protein
MEAWLHQVSLSFPAITSLVSIGKSYNNKDIWCLELSDNPGTDEEEPGVFFMGLHHAREWPTMEICIYLIETLTAGYGINQTISAILNNRRIWIVPCVNPDGFIYDHDENAGVVWWRKNRHFFEEFDTYGVDLNRNYAGACNGNPLGMWGSTGMSHDPISEVYCGTSPFSEVETQAIRRMFLENDICATISWHTSGELVMWPWGYTLQEVAPDHAYLAEVGRAIASRIATQDGLRTYTPSQSAGLYPTTGDTIDWAYGYYHYVIGKPLLAYTIEACQSFHPEDQVLNQVCKENVEGAIYLLQEVENIGTRMIPRVLPPLMHDITIEPNGSFIVSWEQSNPQANATVYQLEELSNLIVYTDTCEIDNDVWLFDGFSTTDETAFSDTLSYTSGRQNNAVSSMTSRYPIYIEEGMKLSFQCFYDIEENNDVACIEVSRDGRFYDILDIFTGSSSDWILKTYDLQMYNGQSIFLRFRYATDAHTIGKGFFVDDVSPVSNYLNVNTLSESLFSQSFAIPSRPDGIYYYQVKGYNDAQGWSDNSVLMKVEVNITNNHPPNPPKLSGVERGKSGESYEYTIVSSDIDKDTLYYYIVWGDGSSDEWLGPFDSDETITVEHSWKKQGDFVIKVRAKDSHQCMGEWSTFPVTMPKQSRNIDTLFKSLSLSRILSLFSF